MAVLFSYQTRTRLAMAAATIVAMILALTQG